MSWRVTLKGVQEAQRANLKAMAALKPRGSFGRAILGATTEAHRYAVAITHVWRYKGGGLRASHRVAIEGGGRRGRIFIDPTAVNPRGQRPAEYGPHEHARGGSHAFYERTVRERGGYIGRGAIAIIQRGLP